MFIFLPDFYYLIYSKIYDKNISYMCRIYYHLYLYLDIHVEYILFIIKINYLKLKKMFFFFYTFMHIKRYVLHSIYYFYYCMSVHSSVLGQPKLVFPVICFLKIIPI